jgi:putative transposase
MVVCPRFGPVGGFEEGALIGMEDLAMPRRARLKFAGLPMHIMHRGNNHGDCFWRPTDRRLYLCLLDEFGPKYECAIHAYVLMTNHVHLLMTPAAAEGASRLMKAVAQRYVQYVNRKLGRSGTLWEGRFKSSIVDSQSYLLQCHRYIELNPVRARMVADPAEYAWSSFATNAMGDRSTLITPHERYLALGATEDERRAAYRELFAATVCSDELRRIRDAINGGFAVGSDDFIRGIETAVGRCAKRSKL